MSEITQNTSPTKLFEELPDAPPKRKIKLSLAGKIGVGVLPGNNFGENGEGYIRMCYATSQEDILLALSRLKNLFG